MKEQLVSNIFEENCLRVYPHLPDDAGDWQMASAGHVEATLYWPDDSKPEKKWGLFMNISYANNGPLSREKTNELQAAIERVWLWIAEQEKNDANLG